MSLSLYGGLSRATVVAPFNASPDTPKHNIIHGNSLDGCPITLFNAFYTKWNSNITSLDLKPKTQVDLRASRLSCSILIKGIHLSSENEPFSKCQIKIPFLEHWIGKSPFKVQVDNSLSEINIDYSRPENEEFEINDHDCYVRLVHLASSPAIPYGTSPQVRHISHLEIEPYEPQSMEWFIKYTSELVDFLGVTYGGSILSKQINLYKKISEENQIVPIYFCRKKAKVEQYERNSFMVRYEDIKSMFQEILTGWLNATHKEKLARNMLISNERRPPDFLELRFLPLAHAAEVLSYETDYSTIVEKHEFKNIKKEMLDSVSEKIPSELKQSINNCLQWANGRNLKGKLKSVLNDLEEKTRSLFCVDSDLFIDGIVNTRNHYTHYSTKPGKKILQGVELHWGIQKLSLMVRILLLLRSGVDEKIIQTKFGSDNRLAVERVVWMEICEEGSEYRVN